MFELANLDLDAFKKLCPNCQRPLADRFDLRAGRLCNGDLCWTDLAPYDPDVVDHCQHHYLSGLEIR